MGQVLTMLGKYLWALLNRAAKGSVLLTDRLTILLVPFSTFVLWGLGVEMTDSLQETFWLGVAVTVTAVVLLRFAFAGYILWKEDQLEKAALKARYDHERARPDRLQREAAKAHVIALRNQLGAVLASHVSYAELRASASPGFEPYLQLYESDYIASFRQVRDLLNSLSYDVPLRVVCHELHHYCSKIIADGTKTSPEAFDTLQSLKKIAFRLIFKDDETATLEVLSLAEAENLLGKLQDPGGKLAELQQLIRDPEVLSLLRREIEAGSPNRGETLN